MKKPRLFLLIAGLILIVGIVACGAGSAPMEATPPESAPMPTATLSLPSSDGQMAASPAIPEQRRLTLEFPPVIRAGDADTVRLTLEMDEMGNVTPTAEIEGHEIGGEVVEIPNLYETHNVIAEARMDLAGVQIVPAENVSEPLLPGKSVTFYWSVRPTEAGEYRGMVWLYLRFVPKEGGEELVRTISAQFVEISATTLFGIKAGPARIAGAVGSFIGAVLGFPFADDVLKWLWKRVRGSKSKV